MYSHERPKKTVAVWGVGHIGITTLSSLADVGYKCIAIDINAEVIINIRNKNDCLPLSKVYCEISYFKIKNAKDIEAFSPDEFLSKKIKIDAHFVSVPTESQGLPQVEDVYSVIQNICDYEKNQPNSDISIIIESTLIPGTAKELHENLKSALPNKTIHFIIAPRRDWFEKDHDMRDIIRIYGAESDVSTSIAEEYLKITTPNLKRASHYEVAEIVKPVENAFRHLDIMLAQQLSLVYSEIDIREVLELAGTKWNMQTYYPSIGIGGYCIPVSSKYILAANVNKENLTLLNAVIDFEERYAAIICEYLCSYNIKNIGIIGATYKNDIPILNGSPIKCIIEQLKERGVKTYVSDILFDEKKLKDYFETGIFNIINIDDYSFDGIIFNNWHSAFDTIINDIILNKIFSCKFILDNTGKLEKFAQSNNYKNYRLFGRPFWKKTDLLG